MIPLVLLFAFLVDGSEAHLDSSELFDYIDRQCEIGVPSARASWEYAGQHADMQYDKQKLYKSCACEAMKNVTHCHNIIGILAETGYGEACPLEGGAFGEAAEQFCGCLCSGNSATYKPALAMATGAGGSSSAMTPGAAQSTNSNTNLKYMSQIQHDCEKCCMPHLSHDRNGFPVTNPHNLPTYESFSGIKDVRLIPELYNARLMENFVYKNTHSQRLGHYLKWCPYKIDMPQEI